MRGTGMMLIALAAMAGSGHAQGVRMPVDADLRSLQAPATYEGSRSQRTQEENGSASTLFGTVRGAGGTPAAAVAVAPPAAPGSPTKSESLTYTVDVWDGDQVVETVAQSSSLSIARAAFKEALKERTKAKVTLRQGETVVAKRDVLATAR